MKTNINTNKTAASMKTSDKESLGKLIFPEISHSTFVVYIQLNLLKKKKQRQV